MNRPIKFRAWGKFSKKMFYWGSEDWGIIMHNNGLRAYEKPPIGCEADELVPMQFTGLHDSEGREIYEGDICNCFNKPDLIEVPGFNHAIIFKHGSFGYETDFDFIGLEENYHFEWNENNQSQHIKIIGNVFESPELVK